MLALLVCATTLATSTFASPNIPLYAQSQSVKPCVFIQNKGQIADFSGKARNEFLFYFKTEKLDVYFRKEGITYIFRKGSEIPRNNKLTREEQDKAMKDFLNEKTLYYRLDVDFIGMNSNSTVIGEGTEDFHYNFYLPQCPEGAMNVPAFEKITYKNVYNGIDFTFYLSNGKFKYDVVLQPGAKLNDVALHFNGARNLQLKNNAIVLNAPVGLIEESLPKSYIMDASGKEQQTIVNYQLNGDEVRFQSEYRTENLLVIDPQISWTTYYDDCFWNGLGSSIDVKGTQCVISSYGFNSNFPTLDPGASAYFQNTNAGSGDFRILKFDTDGVRIWATYYGGTGYDNISHIKIDYSGNIILAGHTESTNIPCQSVAGGYNDATYDAGTTNGGTFIVKFNSAGVRQWATHYDYVSYPFVEVDQNDNVYVVGRSTSNDPPVLALAGAYNQALISHDGGGTNHSTDIFIVKFNSSCARLWATNLGGTTDEFPQDLKCGADNYLNILGISDCYSGTGLITQNPGGSAYYDNTTGPSSTNRDDGLIYRFNTSGLMVWGTAFGGTANENFQQGRITTDNSNNIFIYGETQNTTIPLTNPSGGAYYDNTFTSGGSGFNPFIARFTSAGVLNWCTFFGSYGLGFGMNFSNYIGVNNSNNLILVTTDGGGVGGTFPLVPRAGDYNATQTVYMGIYIAEFASDLSVAYSTYYEGTTDRHTLGDAALSSNSCGYELYMTSNWEKYNASAIDPQWVKPLPSSFQNTTFDAVHGSGLVSRFSNIPSVAPTSITASPPSICAGNSTTLTVNGGSLGTGASWQWYAGGCGSGSAVGSGTSITVSPGADITYYVRAEGICNNTSCASVTVTVSGTSTAASSISPTANPVCPGNPTTLSINGGTLGSGASWQWYTGSCGGTAAGSGNSITVSPGAATTYFVRAEGSCDTSNCVSLLVNVSSLSTAPTSIGATANPICSGDPTTLSVVGGSLGTGASWQWFSGACSGTAAGSGTSISVSPGANTTYYVLAQGSCNTTVCASLLVTVTSNADATILSTSDVCIGDAAFTLSATDAGGSWSGTGITNASTGLFNPATAGVGSHQIIYTISGSCGDADTIMLNVVALINASITPDGPFCVSEAATTLTAANPGGSWSGTGITNAATGLFDPATAGLGDHEIIYTISGSCGNADTITISVVSSLDASISAAGPYCINAGSATLNAANAGGTWSGTGILNATTGLFDPATAGVGPHEIIYTISGACGNADTATILVNPKPSSTTSVAAESCQGAFDGTASAIPTGGTSPYSYLWSNGANTSSILALAPDLYTVVITDANNCFTTDSAVVLASSIACETVVPVVYVPNIFTPNSDGVNDVLYVRGQGILAFTLRIYDRWGEKVFETSDLNIGWDGTFRNKKMDNAVFVYYLHVEFSDATVKDDKGSITMTR